MRTTQKTLAAVLTAGVLLAGAARARAGGETAEARGQQLIEGQQSTIAFAMYPTATLRSISCDRTYTTGDGDFTLHYTFRFKAWYGKSYYAKMRFHFYANGGLDHCAAGETSAWVRPFTAANYVVRWLKGRLGGNAGSADGDQLRRVLDQGDARTLLEWWLKAAQ
jgi:hypothetical protein